MYNLEVYNKTLKIFKISLVGVSCSCICMESEILFDTNKIVCTIYNMSGRVVSAGTNSSRRREFVYPIQHGRERILHERILERDEVYVEKIKVKVCVSQQNSVS